jgi:hypothetical protein
MSGKRTIGRWPVDVSTQSHGGVLVRGAAGLARLVAALPDLVKVRVHDQAAADLTERVIVRGLPAAIELHGLGMMHCSQELPAEPGTVRIEFLGLTARPMREVMTAVRRRRLAAAAAPCIDVLAEYQLGRQVRIRLSRLLAGLERFEIGVDHGALLESLLVRSPDKKPLAEFEGLKLYATTIGIELPDAATLAVLSERKTLTLDVDTPLPEGQAPGFAFRLVAERGPGVMAAYQDAEVIAELLAEAISRAFKLDER